MDGGGGRGQTHGYNDAKNGRTCGGKAACSTRVDRLRKLVLPLAWFLNTTGHQRVTLRATQYKDTGVQKRRPSQERRATMKFCGIDWANDHHDALSIDEQGRQLGSIHVSHTPEGLSQLDAYLERMASPGGREQIACIVETTHGLLIAHLLEQGWPVYPVNPRTVERRRAPSGAKTDTIDAYCRPKRGRPTLRTRADSIPTVSRCRKSKT